MSQIRLYQLNTTSHCTILSVVKVYREKKLSQAEIRRNARNLALSRFVKKVPYGTLLKYLIAVIFGTNLFRAFYTRYYTQTGDAAGFVDVLANPGNSSNLHFAYGDGLVNLRSLISLGNNFVCQDSLSFGGKDFDFYYFHAYLIGYVTRHFGFLSNSPVTFSLSLLALSVTAGLVFIYNHLRNNGVSLPITLTFIVVILINPMFFMGLSWNPYVNRLIFGPSIYVLLKLLNKKLLTRTEYIKVIIAMTLCVLISERSSLFIGIAVFGSMIIRCATLRKIHPFDYFLLAYSCGAIYWYILWSSQITTNKDYSRPSLGLMIDNFTSAMIGERLAAMSTFFLVLLPFLLLIIQNIKLFLLAAVLLAPSIVINDQVGYLNSYYAHYQSDFFAIIVAFAAVCLVNVRRLRIKNPIVIGLLFISVFSTVMYNQSVYSKFAGPQESFSVTSTRYFQEVSNSLGFYFLPNNSEKVKSYLENKKIENDFFMNVALPVKNSSEFISAPEEFMPALIAVGAVNVDYFPVGVGKNKYVIAPYLSQDSLSPDVSIYGVVPVELQKTWSSCIRSILQEQYRVKNVQVVNGRKAILFERK